MLFSNHTPNRYVALYQLEESKRLVVDAWFNRGR
jgi:hypothetical protein